LDVGAGDAWFARHLVERVEGDVSVVCYDINYSWDLMRELKGLSKSNCVFTNEMPCQLFDVILMLDVLEHVEDDDGLLKKIVNQCANSKSVFLISVPAWRALYSNHDRKLKHKRRYNPAEISQLIQNVGLNIEERGGVFLFLLPIRMIEKCMQILFKTNKKSRIELGQISLLGKFVYLILKADLMLGRMLHYFQLDFGLSWWCVCKKK
jgi:hypothetical protein